MWLAPTETREMQLEQDPGDDRYVCAELQAQ